jgi:hypothetical protein
MTLNWRHKAGLLLALTATGLSLFFELSTKQTAGIAVLGIAFAWFIGSITSRALGWLSALLSCLFGLWVALTPIWDDWKSAKELIADYDFAIEALATAVHDTPAYEIAPPKAIDYDALAKKHGAISSRKTAAEGSTSGKLDWFAENAPKKTGVPLPPAGYSLDRNVVIPESVVRWLKPSSRVRVDFYDATGRAVIDFPGQMSDKEIMATLQTILLPRPKFVFTEAIRTHIWRVLGGMLLLAVGLIGGGFFSRTRRVARAQAV